MAGSNPIVLVRRMLRLVLATVLLAHGGAADATTEADVRRLQWDLVWTGHYEGTVDGRPGPSTRRAIRSYQASLGAPETGELSDDQWERLEEQATAIEADMGWTIYESPQAGYRIGYPAAILPVTRSIDTTGQEFSSEDGSVTLATLVTGPDSEESLRQSYDRIVDDNADVIAYQIFKPTWFAVSYVIGESGYYVMSKRKPAATARYVLRWPKAEDAFFRPLATAIYNSFAVSDDLRD